MFVAKRRRPITCIAWDGHTLAADKQATNAGLRRTTTKIYRVGDVLVAIAGNLDQGMLMLDWIANGSQPDQFPASQRDKEDWTPVLVISKEGGLMAFERTPTPCMFEDKFYATGSGRDYALAAMHLGCDARKAVEVACVFDVNCGGGIDTLSLHDEPLPTITP